MTDRIEEIRARWAAVESAPWVHREGDPDVDSVAGGLVAIVAPFASVRTVIAQGADYNHADAEAIAHAPEDVAFLLAEVERLRVDARIHEAQHRRTGEALRNAMSGAVRPDIHAAERTRRLEAESSSTRYPSAHVNAAYTERTLRLEAESRAEGYRIERDEAWERAQRVAERAAQLVGKGQLLRQLLEPVGAPPTPEVVPGTRRLEAEVAKLQAVVEAAREAAGKAYVAGGRGDPGAADLRCYVDTRHIVFLREALAALDADTEAGG